MFHILLTWFILFISITFIYHLIFGLNKGFFIPGIIDDDEQSNIIFPLIININYLIYVILITFCLVYVGSAILTNYGYNFIGYMIAILIGIVIMFINNRSCYTRFQKVKLYCDKLNFNNRVVEIYSAPLDIVIYIYSILFPSQFIDFGILLNNLL